MYRCTPVVLQPVVCPKLALWCFNFLTHTPIPSCIPIRRRSYDPDNPQRSTSDHIRLGDTTAIFPLPRLLNLTHPCYTPPMPAIDALYLHVPFCVRKCGYCDFYSEAAAPGDMDRYLAAVEREMQRRAAEFPAIRPATVFFGGGTPTMLTAAHLRQLGDALHRQFDLSGVVEWTSECNPGTLTPEKADALAGMGVNRISFGAQSFNPKYLKLLDRMNEHGRLDTSREKANAAGIVNHNIDLIFAIPGQTMEEWVGDLDEALSRQSQHLALYALTYEDDTPLTHRKDGGEFEPMDPELEAAMYRETVARMRAAGFARYEVSNFARPGRQSLHNGHYWASNSWIGIGPGAHSGLDARLVKDAPEGAATIRWGMASDHRAYAKALLDQESDAKSFEETLRAGDAADEYLMMGLRRETGVSDAEMRARVGIGIADRCGPAIDELASAGLVTWDGQRLACTDDGMLLLDSIVLELTQTPAVLG